MMKDMTIAAKLGMGFGVIVLLLVAALWFSLNRMATVNNLMKQVVQEDWQKAQLANESALTMNAIARSTFSYVLFNDHQAASTIESGRVAINQRMLKLRELVRLPAGIELMSKIKQAREDYVGAYQEVVQKLQQDEVAQGRVLMQQRAMPALDRLLPLMEQLVDLQGQVLQDSGAQVQRYYLESQRLIWMFMALALVVSTVMAWWIIRSVTRPLGGEPGYVKEAVERIANGNLQVDLKLRAGDHNSLMVAMARMQTNLREMITTLTGNADNVAGAALQLAAASKQITVSSADQAHASTSMAAAVEEMSTSIGLVSSNAAEALTITGETQQLSSNSEQVFHDTVSSMRRISETVATAARNLNEMEQHAQNISGIVQLISDVAEQTNLLALNAAIEAARAGEQGRGFAVVADEVRQLAERTSKATTEIAHMIAKVQGSAGAAEATMSAVVQQVGEGMGLAEQAGESMRGIGMGAEKVLNAVDGITVTLNEQNSVSEEIAQRIEQVAQMSEENHQAITEVMQTAELLERLASETQGAVRRFQL